MVGINVAGVLRVFEFLDRMIRYIPDNDLVISGTINSEDLFMNHLTKLLCRTSQACATYCVSKNRRSPMEYLLALHWSK